MKDIDKVKFQEIMLGCGEIYNREITKPLLSIYFSALNDLSIEQVIASVGVHIKDTKHGSFFPKPCDIIRNSSKVNLINKDDSVKKLQSPEDAIKEMSNLL
jgi:hypothetical protein